MLKNNIICNFPLTVEDMKRAIAIYSTEIQGMTVQIQGAGVATTQVIPIPAHIQAHRSTVALAMDIFFVQGQRFHHSILGDIKFRTMCIIKYISKSSLLNCCKAAIQIYHNRGTEVTHKHTGNVFACIMNDIASVFMNIKTTYNHVGEAERFIKTIKEQVGTKYMAYLTNILQRKC
jgi:hypothetical protein